MTTTVEPWSNVLSLAEVMALYQEGMAKGGKASSPANGCLERSLGAAWNAELYQQEEAEGLPGLLFASSLLYYLVNNHCFTDGNKRISWSCFVAVFRFYDLAIRATDDEAVQLVLDAVGKPPEFVNDITRWVAGRLEAADDPAH